MPESRDFEVRLVARTEGITYTDPGGVHHFDVSLKKGEWTIKLPATNAEFGPHEMTADEEARILPRITAYLSRIKWFGIFPRSYTVRTEREKYAGHDLVGTKYPGVPGGDHSRSARPVSYLS